MNKCNYISETNCKNIVIPDMTNARQMARYPKPETCAMWMYLACMLIPRVPKEVCIEPCYRNINKN